MDNLIDRRRLMIAALQGGGGIDNYLTFTALEDNSSVKLVVASGTPDTTLNIDVDINNTGFVSYTVGDTITLTTTGDYVKMRGLNSRISASNVVAYTFVMTGRVAASGDVTSLLNGIGGDVELPVNCFNSLFKNCKQLATAPNLPSTIINTYSYGSMFENCIGLTYAPDIACTTVKGYREMSRMFANCQNLVTGPTIHVQSPRTATLYELCSGCSKLNYIKIYTTATASYAFTGWLYNVSASGEVVCPQELTLPTDSVNGIPVGWTRRNLDGTIYNS